MKIELIISEAESKGMQIDYALVNAGKGTTKIQVRKIDGQSFTGSAGNNTLRARMNQRLSPKELRQRAKANRSVRMGKREKEKLKEHNRQMRKMKGPTVSQKKYKQRKARSGKTEVIKQLRNSERHKSGFAYGANIDYFIMLIKQSVYVSELQPVVDWLNSHKRWVNDETLFSCMNILYDLQNSTPPYDMITGPMKAKDDMLQLLKQGVILLKETK